uniref:NADH-ubiquinone oxidoreductase chain 5 n=1 Tax=Trisidos kiyonoi TaxID=935009 RepID=A0A1U9ALR0_TRIKY|nr:NADH dehydrogenase subunit 5 [Trisidos kiyonoi]
MALFSSISFMMISMWLYGLGKSLCVQVSLVSSVSELFEGVFVIDFLSMSFLGVVCFISGFVVIYSIVYMSSLETSSRFLAVLMVFVVSMGFLLVVPSVLGMIIGWDGLGLSSFLLVVFYQNSGSLSSGVITALTNRIGDGLILVGMGLSLVCGHWSLYYGAGCGVMLCFVIILASMTKSAQMPFCSWLPAAMAAPTPVSSLVHSSTLVTAGVYLLIRYSEIVCSEEYWGLILMIVGCFTTIMSGANAIMEVDVKKVVALSTLSQLGMMVFIIGLGFPLVCLFHVYMHALFKSLLFMGVGSIIHLRNDQDIYRLGMGYLDVPFVSGMIILSCFCLGGVPFLCGYFSKDVMVELCLGSDLGLFFMASIVVSAIFTVMYSIRLCKELVSNFWGHYPMSMGGDSWVMILSMIGLGASSLLVGEVVSEMVGVSSWIFLEGQVKLVPMFVLLLGWYVYWFFFLGDLSYGLTGHKKHGFLWSFISHMWFLPCLNHGTAVFGLGLSEQCIDSVEAGWMEYVPAGVIVELLENVGEVHCRAQSLDYDAQMGLMIVSVVVIVGFCFFVGFLF